MLLTSNINSNLQEAEITMTMTASVQQQLQQRPLRLLLTTGRCMTIWMRGVWEVGKEREGKEGSEESLGKGKDRV